MASTRCGGGTTMANRLAILLTATIDPRGMTRLKRTDPAAREADYAAALAFWQQQGLPVVFCENSGTRSPKIEALAADHAHTEILVFDDPHRLPARGKGYGEMRLVAHALNHSSLLAHADLIVKVTGRYRRRLRHRESALRESLDLGFIPQNALPGRAALPSRLVYGETFISLAVGLSSDLTGGERL